MREKKARDRLIRLAESHPDWVLGFQDETWWSRLALPALHVWEKKETSFPLVERSRPKEDTAPKALSCYGLLRANTGEMLLRFVQGRSVSQVTEEFLAWSIVWRRKSILDTMKAKTARRVRGPGGWRRVRR